MKQNWIKQRRKEIGITQEELARRLQLSGQDVSRATVSHWEIDHAPVPMKAPEFVTSLSRALELPLIDMLYRAGYIESKDLSEEANRAAAIVEAMTPDRKRTALAVLEQLSKE